MIYKLLILGHFIGDFYVQSDKMAVEKGRNSMMFLKHCIFYMFSIFICSFFAIEKQEIAKYMICIFGISTIHGVIDFIKKQIEKKNKIAKKYGTVVFLGDQLLHVFTIIVFYRISPLNFNLSFLFTGKSYDPILINNGILCLLGAFLCAKPAGIFVKMILAEITKDNNAAVDTDHKENANAGFLIGVLEREIILFLGILGQFGAIGFVLTAKSIARFKQLEDKNFSEKYLVGTLLSVFIAILCVGIYNI